MGWSTLHEMEECFPVVAVLLDFLVDLDSFPVSHFCPRYHFVNWP